MKTMKKAFLSTIRLAVLKIQKNSHLVINENEEADNDVGARATSRNGFPVQKNCSLQ